MRFYLENNRQQKKYNRLETRVKNYQSQTEN